ncbi:hypothetical protein GCM10007919_22270 [Rhizobium indigoferae]|nr:hypothetical protein GCM10007919_22270 [Rhizobium indigoferae]
MLAFAQGANNLRSKARALLIVGPSYRSQGAPTEEIVEGYPALTARMADLAEIWAAAHPARGRPRKLSEQGLKVKSVKRLPLGKAGTEKPSGTAT